MGACVCGRRDAIKSSWSGTLRIVCEVIQPIKWRCGGWLEAPATKSRSVWAGMRAHDNYTIVFWPPKQSANNFIRIFIFVLALIWSEDVVRASIAERNDLHVRCMNAAAIGMANTRQWGSSRPSDGYTFAVQSTSSRGNTLVSHTTTHRRKQKKERENASGIAVGTNAETWHRVPDSAVSFTPVPSSLTHIHSISASVLERK